MPDNVAEFGFELICVIVDFGKGSGVVQTAKKFGVSGGTIILGKGTENNVVKDFLGLSDIRREIILMVSEKHITGSVLEELDEKLHFENKRHGIAFTLSINEVIGSVGHEVSETHEKKEGEEKMYCAITVIVDRGKAEKVIDTAAEAGSKGGTIINARGSGIHDTSKLFFMAIEPDKEIVLILAERKNAEAIVSLISERMEIEKPGKGIIFIQEVSKVYGLVK